MTTTAHPPAPASRRPVPSKTRKANRSLTVGRRLAVLKYVTTDDGEYLLAQVGVARIVRVVKR